MTQWWRHLPPSSLPWVWILIFFSKPRTVTKISSCWVNTTSRLGIKQLGISFGSIFLIFSYESSRGPHSLQPGEIPGPHLLMIALNPTRVCGLSLLLVLILALRGFLGTLDLPSPRKNQYFWILIRSGIIVKGPPCGWVTSDPLFILFGFNNIIICARMFGSPFFLEIYMNLKTFSKIPEVIKWSMMKTSSG